MRKNSNFIASLSRRHKQAIVAITDILYTEITVWLSFCLRYEQIHIFNYNEIYAYLIPLLIAPPIFYHLGLYRSIFRYSGLSSLVSVAKACLLYGVIYAFIVIFIVPEGIPRSIGILQPILLLIFLGASRAFARVFFSVDNTRDTKENIKEKIIIYGAGSSGVQIANALKHNAQYKLEAFIDDDKNIQGKNINGIIVYSKKEIPKIIKKKNVTSILIAMPSIKRSLREEIYKSLEVYSVHIRTLPGIDALAGGKISLSNIREIDIEDLLGRDIVPPDKELFSKCITEKTVLVTGAGGSIGSELCRQILNNKPNKLILLDNCEFNLYSLEKELVERIKTQLYDIKLTAILADVTDKEYMNDIFLKNRPETVYHTAAYKHVPIVEENPCEGLRNNVFGTLYLAEAAKNSGVRNFVLVSTDKAVRPTNIMGASKRIAELILQAISDHCKNEHKTCYSMVRFGNVLGSSGSVVPLFREQIKKGGPVTITDREMTRYFMTITEAAQLVIQAGAMAIGGEVFLLDMGNPVKILDLAKRMIELSGLTIKYDNSYEGDIEIVFTGLRPGEKLYEELLIGDNPIPTKHPLIFKAHETFYQFNELKEYLQLLEYQINKNKQNTEELKKIIQKIVKGYCFR